MRATVLRQELVNYNELVRKYLPTVCPRCNSVAHLVLDPDDPSYAYCWSHFGEIYIGPVRENIVHHDRGGMPIDRVSKLINAND